MNSDNFNDEDAMTTWVNDNDVTAKFTVLGDNGKFRTLVIAPGEQKNILSQYDSAIRKEVNGVVVAGACPWLKKLGEDEVKLHPSLDYKSVLEADELTTLAQKISADKSLAEAKEVRASRKPKKAQ